jgi:8-oxo-dGTP pyrophosphatase MutT (NUDIX family)
MLDDRLLNPCRVWDLRQRRYRNPVSGAEGDFFYLDSRDWGLVLALTPEREVVLVRQFRWGSDEFSWEIPGGIVERGEDPAEAGLRELREETGYTAEAARVIGSCRPNPAILNNHAHIVLAENARPGSATDWDEHEEMEVRTVPLDEVMRMAADGTMTHALALNALLYYSLCAEDGRRAGTKLRST